MNSVNLEDDKLIISYQGTFGCFSYQACKKNFPNAQYKGCKTFSNAMELVLEGRADVAFIPVDNSTAGRVMEVYNHIPDSGLFIVGEFFMPIHHCLMMPTKAVRGAPPETLDADSLIAWKERDATKEELDVAMKKITEVFSHPQGLAQCRKFLENNLPNAKLKETWDTAGAARDLERAIDLTQAAIAPYDAIRYNMTIIRENVEDDPDNTTRFLMLAKEAIDGNVLAEKVNSDIITTIMFQTKNEAGSLVTALEVFRKHNINLTKLETYMMGEKHSQPHFYVDVLFNPETEKGKKVLNDLKAVTLGFKALGSYEASNMR